MASILIARGAPAAEPARPVAVRGNAAPSFRITPLVQRLSGRQGQRIRFAFDVQSLGAPQTLQIRAVGLKQELNGLVTVDDAAPPPDEVEVFGPRQLELKPEETATIRGHVDVPLSEAPFHAFGVLVTDLGRPLQEAPAGGSPLGIGVRFVTRYLLRIEVDVQNGRPENAKALRVESANLVEREGLPVVEADVFNPTDAAVEFQLHARLLRSDGSQAVPSFGMALPVRFSRPEEERFESMVFGHNRVRLQAPLSEGLFPGEYQLELSWISARRKCGSATFRVNVRENDFPAQAANAVQIAQAIRVSPAQIELSLGRGGSRRVPVRFANDSGHPLQIRLKIENFAGTPAGWARVSPAEFDLPPGRDRNILVTAQAGSDVESHRYGVLRVMVGSTESKNVEAKNLTLALLGRTMAAPDLNAGQIRWEGEGDRPAFVLPLENRGTVHVPLHARLTVRDLLGEKLEIASGFGRWLLPGEDDEIRFRLQRPLPPGKYEVQVHLRTAEDRQPLEIRRSVRVQTAR